MLSRFWKICCTRDWYCCFKVSLVPIPDVPVFDLNCPKEVVVNLNYRVNVTCTVNADPPVTEAHFYWFHRKETEGGIFVENRALNFTLIPKAQSKPLVNTHPGALWEKVDDYYGITYMVG